MFNPSQFPFLDPILELTNTEKVFPPSGEIEQLQ